MKYKKEQIKSTEIEIPAFLPVVFLVVALFLSFSFFVWTLYPYAQMARFVKKFDEALAGNPKALIESRFSFYPYTSVQPAIRYKLITYLFFEYKEGRLHKESAPLVEFAIDKMDEIAKKTDNFPYFFSSIGKAYDQVADLLPEKAQQYHVVAEGYYKKAISLSPGNYNQDAKFTYAINMANQGRADEAVALMRETVAYDTRPAEPHYFLGIMLFKHGESHWDESLSEMEYSFDHGFDPGQGLAKKIYERFLRFYYNKKDVGQFIIVAQRLSLLDKDQSAIYKQIIELTQKNNSIPLLNIN